MIYKRLLILVTIFILLLSSCDNSKTVLSTKSEAKTISINIGNTPKTLNPAYAYDKSAINIIRHINEGLVCLDEHNNPTPGIAEKWTISQTQLKYTFTLRNAKWGNGLPLTAYDFEYAFEKILNSDNKSLYAEKLFLIKNGKEYYNKELPLKDVGFAAVNEHTFEIYLNYPAPYFLQLLATTPFMPVNKEFSEIHGAKYGTKTDYSLSNGPWVVKEWLNDNKLVLEKNKLYWNSYNIDIDKINMIILDDSKKVIDKFTTEDLNIGIIENKFVPYAKEKGFTPIPHPEGSTQYIEFNLKNNILNNINIRKAIYSALDRKFIARGVHNKINEMATSFTHSGILGRHDLFYKEVGDLTRVFSKELSINFYNDGLKELAIKKIPPINFLYNNTEYDRMDAAAVKKYLEEIPGIEINMVPKSNKDYLADLKSKNFQMALESWKGSYNDPESYLKIFQTNNPDNHSSYSNALYDDAVMKIKDNKSSYDRFKMLNELEIDLSIDLPIIPLYYTNTPILLNQDIDGFISDNYRDFYLYYVKFKK